MPVTFDGPSTTITLPSTGSYNAEIDLYSDWKEWVLQGDSAKYLPAFDTTGGDDIGSGQEIAPYFFLRTDLGWTIKAPEQDGDVIIQGNLFPRVSGQSLFEPPDGDFTVLITQSLSVNAVVVESDGGGADLSGVMAELAIIKSMMGDVHAANFNRRTIANDVITIYESDKLTIRHQFNVTESNGVATEINPV